MEPPHYKLYGVLYHHGESAGSGHIRAGEVWLHIDDEAVTRMRHEDVFGEHGTERSDDERCTS
ncbi:hypothetical protein BGY98DRAFT_1038398 [Russula aff. rugulosa BPL654]|nr:hypothetical protein BGY98DRAFT_1038398 [Russula aff. rugulosa BPL654]